MWQAYAKTLCRVPIRWAIGLSSWFQLMSARAAAAHELGLNSWHNCGLGQAQEEDRTPGMFSLSCASA